MVQFYDGFLPQFLDRGVSSGIISYYDVKASVGNMDYENHTMKLNELDI